MKTRMILTLGLSALVFGGTMVGCTANGTHVAAASDRDTGRAAKAAAASANKGAKALARKDAAGAIGYLEAAVGLSPRDAGYRMLLGQGYLQAGRFDSARATFADVLQLMPDNGKAALNLALAQIATGGWADARRTLDAHAATIPAGDLGLATALAGNPAGAVAILTPIARSGQGSVKVRQNLALSYALAGEWNMARVVAATDLSPAEVDARMEQWVAFAQPQSAAQQVATLLGVTPAADAGRPVALALNAPVPVGQAVTEVTDAKFAPAAVPAVAPAPAVVAAAETVQQQPQPQPASAVQPARVVFGPSRAVVQAVPSMLIRSDATPVKLALAAPTPASASPVLTPKARAAEGEWFVQLGAFSNPTIAQAGWTAATRRFGQLGGHQPNGAKVVARQGALYRLSVGGFTRADADAMCRSYRARGGACFVRREAGDRMAQWLRTPVQMASR